MIIQYINTYTCIQSDIVGGMLWFIAVVSPHGALCMALLHIGDVCRSVHADVCVVRRVNVSLGKWDSFTLISFFLL
jgi:hypothetical protein